MGSLCSLWLGLVSRKTEEQDGWSFQPHPLMGQRCQVSHIQTLELQDLMSSQVGASFCQDFGTRRFPQDRSSSSWDPPGPCLCTSLSSCSSVAFITSFVINQYSSKQTIFLSFVNSFSQLIKPEKGVVGSYDLYPVSQTHRTCDWCLK